MEAPVGVYQPEYITPLLAFADFCTQHDDDDDDDDDDVYDYDDDDHSPTHRVAQMRL